MKYRQFAWFDEKQSQSLNCKRGHDSYLEGHDSHKKDTPFNRELEKRHDSYIERRDSYKRDAPLSIMDGTVQTKQPCNVLKCRVQCTFLIACSQTLNRSIVEYGKITLLRNLTSVIMLLCKFHDYVIWHALFSQTVNSSIGEYCKLHHHVWVMSRSMSHVS